MKTFSVFECHIFMVHYTSLFFEKSTTQVKYGNRSGLAKSKASHETHLIHTSFTKRYPFVALV
jgi:hypothetical protein